MRMKSVVPVVMAGCAVIALSSTPMVSAQTAPQHKPAATADAKPAAGMPAKCQAMMAEREKMMADMKVADQRIDDLVAKMNNASSAEKTAATAAVVTEMVAQRRAMRDGTMKMQHGMMGHMMEHQHGRKGSMGACPMMKQMGGMEP